MAEWILGIETSCDETSAAVLRRDGAGAELAGLVILSQDVHRIFGGVVSRWPASTASWSRRAPAWSARCWSA
jgi:tRNA A37 threonylcarbamoyltransferase TsaD